jgi:hypothetical protein
VHGKKLIAIAVTMACSPSLFAEEFNEDKVMEEVFRGADQTLINSKKIVNNSQTLKEANSQ